MIKEMVLSQGFEIDDSLNLIVPKDTKLKMTIPTELIPYCPDDGQLMITNLRSDDKFIRDDGWYLVRQRYEDFINHHKDLNVLFF